MTELGIRKLDSNILTSKVSELDLPSVKRVKQSDDSDTSSEGHDAEGERLEKMSQAIRTVLEVIVITSNIANSFVLYCYLH